MTLEEAEQDNRRSILLQCIGASDYVEPDFFTGTMQPDQMYLLCCDGFRHVISANEFCRYMGPRVLRDEKKHETVIASADRGDQAEKRNGQYFCDFDSHLPLNPGEGEGLCWKMAAW